jgi:hypothetical protein
MFVWHNRPMTPLSPPVARRLIHTRDVRTRGFLRDDGLWDLEGELLDEKSYTYADRERGPLPAGSPMHHMRARLTVDHELNVVAAEIDMPAIPFSLCAGAADPAKDLTGKSLGRGFRRALEEAMGGTSGCTHVRYLILALANTAYQTISAYREQFMPELGAPKAADGERPFFLNQCRSWDDRGAVVARFFPRFHRD